MNISYISKVEELDEVVNWLQHQSYIGVDTETTGLSPLTSKVLLLQFGTIHKQYVLDAARIGKRGILRVLETMNNPKITKVLHNSVFDYSMIKTNYGVELLNMKCTMLGEQLLIQGRSQSAALDAVVKKYLGHVLEKSTRDTFQNHSYGDAFSEEQINYSGEDVEYLVQLHERIQSLLDSRGMHLLSELEYETAPVLGNMSIDGIYLDKTLWTPLEEKAKVGLLAAKEKLDSHFKEYIDAHAVVDLFGTHVHEINYDSPKQVLPRLREITKLELSSTDAKYLEFYKDKHSAISDLINYRQEQKKISTYGTAFLEHINPIDNRIHSQFKQLHAQTGRMSSDNPNMMNLPKSQEYRTPFCVQDPSWNFISADFSGQELRLLAHASQEPEFIKALKEKIDLHRYSASLLFKKPYESISDEERGQCKSITFALLYGAGPKKLSTKLNISYDDAKALMNRYFTVFTQVKKFMDQIVRRVEQEHYALSPLDGRRVDLTAIDWDNKALVAHAVNQSKNLPFQGAGASTTKLALVKINNIIKNKKLKARIVNAIHDEILVEVAPEDTDEVKVMVEREMISAFNNYASSVPMEVTAEVGKHWIH